MRTVLLAFLLLAATAGEDRVTAYFDAFNKGEEAMLAFIQTHISDAKLKERPAEQRISIYRQMKNNIGTLAVGGILSDGPNVVRVNARSSNGEHLQFIFELEPQPPHKILGIGVENTGDGPPPPQRPAGPLEPAKHIGAVSRHLDTLAEYGLTGAVRVIHDGRIILDKNLGYADRAARTPITSETVFDIGSLVKDFTRSSIHRLANEKKLTLDDNLGKFFPSLPEDKAKLTIRQLLDHETGLPLGLTADAVSVTKEQFLSQLAGAKLGKPEYSNPGYSALAAIIEHVTGQSYETYVKKTIFDPLGMKDTGYVLVSWPAHRRVHAYRDGADEGNTLDYPHLEDGNSWSLRGNGGMLSTLSDMQRFYEAVDAGKVPGLEGRGDGVEVGGNMTHYFLHHSNSRDKLRILVATTDSSYPAGPVDRRITSMLRGGEVPALPAPVARPAKAATYGNFRLTPVERGVVVTPLDQNAINAMHGLKETPAFAKSFNERSAAVAREHVPASAIARLGAIKDVRVLGTFPAPPRAPGMMIRGLPDVARTDVRIVHENGESRVRLLWNEKEVRTSLFAEGPAGTRFLPIANDAFAHYDLKADALTRMTIVDGKIHLSS